MGMSGKASVLTESKQPSRALATFKIPVTRPMWRFWGSMLLGNRANVGPRRGGRQADQPWLSTPWPSNKRGRAISPYRPRKNAGMTFAARCLIATGLSRDGASFSRCTPPTHHETGCANVPSSVVKLPTLDLPTAPVSHQKRREQTTTNAIKLERKRCKINEAGR